MNQNPEQQPPQGGYPPYSQYDPTQAAPPPYDPTQLASSSPYPDNQGGYSSPAYPVPPSQPGNSSPDYYQQPPYSQPPSYPIPNSQPNAGGYSGPGSFGPPAYPGYPPAPKKNRTWLWVTLGIVGVLLVAMIASCTIFSNAITNLVRTEATATPYTTTPTSTDVTPTASSSNDNNGSNVLSGGDSGQTRTLQNVNCTMSQVRVIPGDDYAQPKAGKQFVQLHIKIDNTTNEKQHYNPLDFQVLTSDGASLTHSYIVPTAYDKQLSFGDIPPGKSVEGDLIFELPTSDHNMKLNWDPPFNTYADNPGQARWKLPL